VVLFAVNLFSIMLGYVHYRTSHHVIHVICVYVGWNSYEADVYIPIIICRSDET